MPDQGRPSAKPACMSQALLPPTRQMATTPSALDWLARVIAALTLLPQVVHQQRKSDGVGARALALDTRDCGRPGACPPAQAIVIIRLRTTDDICDLPPASHLPSRCRRRTHTHTHTTSAPIARFCLLACCRTLSSRSAAAAVTFRCTAQACLTLSAPGKERRARALVESHSLTHMWWVFAAVTMFQGVSIPSSTRSRGSPPRDEMSRS